MLRLALLARLCVVALSQGPAPACIDINHGIAPPSYSKFTPNVTLPLSEGFSLNGNGMGIEGHHTTISQCSFKNTSEAFGWSWNRGKTAYACSDQHCYDKYETACKTCPYPKCYYQFGCNGFHTNKKANIETLDKYIIDTDLTFSWNDTNPSQSSDPHSPATYKTRLIFDFFLKNVEPQPQHSLLEGVTDEIVIQFIYNKDFSLPCNNGIALPSQPIEACAISFGGECYDFLGNGFDEPSANVFAQIAVFSRSGGETNSTMPSSLDLKKFVDYAKKQPRVKPFLPKSGSWVGSVGLINEIYDNTQGRVQFNSLPKIHSVPKGKASFTLV
jgi:hypothetical protein